MALYPGGSRTHCNDITADLGAGAASGTGFGTDTLDGIEQVWTGGGNDVLVGDDGTNEFSTGFSCDQSLSTESVDGNGGLDLVTFNTRHLPFVEVSSPAPVEVDLVAHTADWGDQSSVIALESIENVTGTEHADVLLGDGGPNSLSGGNGRDVVNGREGDDELLGDTGDDSLDGGPGASHKTAAQARHLPQPEPRSARGRLRR